MENIDVLEQTIEDIDYNLLKILLKDKTTGKYILWATDDYEPFGHEYKCNKEIIPALIIGNFKNLIQPRVFKKKSEQMKRTREKGEIFTPSWLCNAQNNLVDDEWFGEKNIFNNSDGFKWNTNNNPIRFPKGKKWTHYVDARRLEISCGEAPYLVSRYDTISGKPISIINRIGLLDRKLRVVSENSESEEEWFKWTVRAFQSVYGFEFQGDNVLLARKNLLYSFIDYFNFKFNKEPSLVQIKKIAIIISWNIWQMDGLTCSIPYSNISSLNNEIPFFDMFGSSEDKNNKNNNDNKDNDYVYSKVRDWRANKSLEFRTLINSR